MKFKEGDRAAGDWSPAGEHGYKRVRGTVMRVEPTFVSIQPDTEVTSYHCSPKSVRLLKKRERRQWTIKGGARISESGFFAPSVYGPSLNPDETVTVIEARPCKK